MKKVLTLVLGLSFGCGGADLFAGCDEKVCAAKGQVCGKTISGTNPATGTPTVGVGCVDPVATKASEAPASE